MAGFAVGEAKALPKRYLVGTWEMGNKTVQEERGWITSSGNYIRIPLKLNAIGGGSRNPFVTFYYHPDWLKPEFRVSQLEKTFFYNKNICQKGKLGTLAAFAGSYEGFSRLAATIFEMGEDVHDPAKVYDVLAEFHAANPGRTIGFVMEQKQSKTDEVDPETGRDVYVKEDGYEVKGYFVPNNERHVETEWAGTLKQKQKEAAKSGGKVRFDFDPEVAF